MQTYGEQLVEGLLKALPKNEYFWVAEPTIVTDGESNRRNPDFVIVSASMGVIVLEVKDWIRIERVNPRETEIKRRDGTVSIEQNPIKIAREYALNLADRFESRKELLNKAGRYVGKLKFPWFYAAAFPILVGILFTKLKRFGSVDLS